MKMEAVEVLFLLKVGLYPWFSAPIATMDRSETDGFA